MKAFKNIAQKIRALLVAFTCIFAFLTLISCDIRYLPECGHVDSDSSGECDKCGERHYIFGKSDVESLGIETVSRIPMTPALANKCDNGKIEEFEASWLDEILDKIEKI